MDIISKFRASFVGPLVFGILLSTILTIIILTVFSISYYSAFSIKKLKEIEYSISIQRLETASFLIKNIVQKTINNLNIINNYYDFFMEIPKIRNKNKFDNLVNGFKILYQQQIKQPFDSRATWFIRSDITSFDQINKEYIDEVMSISAVFDYMIPILQALKNNNYFNIPSYDDNVSSFFASKNMPIFYASYHKADWMMLYPILRTDSFYNSLIVFVNHYDCTDEEGYYKNYYYFKCRPWYKKLTLNIEDTKSDIMVIPPYKSADNNDYVISVCKRKFYDNKRTLGNLITMCIDYDISHINKFFDIYNSNTDSYFFAMLTGEQVPLYYPNISKLDHIQNVESYEFDLYSQYNLDELKLFKKEIIKNFTKSYELDELSEIYSSLQTISTNEEEFREERIQMGLEGTYEINDNHLLYKIIPIFLSIEKGEYKNLLNFILIRDPKSASKSLDRYLDLISQKNVIQIFLFILIGLILFLIAWFLVTFIAEWIKKPIKSMKQSIKIIGSSEINTEIKEKIDDVIQEEDEDNQINSSELGKLFDILIEIKNCLSYASSDTLYNDEQKLLNYIYSIKIFNKVSNVRGLNLSQSNVGNMLMEFNKFDKALLHLLELFNVKELYESLSKIISSKSFFKNNEGSVLDNVINFVASIDVNKFQIQFNKGEKDKKNNKLENNEKKFEKTKSNLKMGNLVNNKMIKKMQTNIDSSAINKNQTIENTEMLNETIIEKSEVQNDHKDEKNEIKNYNFFNKENSKLNIERFEKILIAYKQMYKVFGNFLNKLAYSEKKIGYIPKKEVDIFELIISDELLSNDKIHSLEYYQLIVISYLIECVVSENKEKLLAGIIELIEYIIFVRLDFEEMVNKDLQIHKININLDTSKTKETYAEKKIPTDNNQVKNLISLAFKCFNKFDEIYNILKSDINQNFYKSFLNKLKQFKNNSKYLINPPIIVFKQKSMYLKGCLSMLSGHYKLALEFFESARIKKVICDIKTIENSTEKIIMIINYLETCMKKEIDNISEELNDYKKSKVKAVKAGLNTNLIDTKINQLKSKQEVINISINKNSELIKKYIEDVSFYQYKSKDVLVLLDINEFMLNDKKNIEKSIKISKHLYEESISKSDRYGLMTFNSNIIFSIKFGYKNKFNNNFVSFEHETMISNFNSNSFEFQNAKELENKKIKRSINKKNTNISSNRTASNLGAATNEEKEKLISGAYDFRTCVHNAYSYLKKLGNPERIKWLIIFTNNYMKKKSDANIFEIFKLENNFSSIYNIIFVGYSFNKELAEHFSSKLNGINSSIYIDSENINLIPDIIKDYGDITEKIKFKNEVYEAEEEIINE